MTSLVSRLEPGSRLVDNYELNAQLSPRTWRAWDHGKGQAVVVKVYGLADAAAVTAFEEGAKLAAQLGHSSRNIVKVLGHHVVAADGGETCGVLVMEHLAGETLAQKLTARGRLSLVELRPIVAQLALALKALHNAGALHLGLRPERVFITHVATPFGNEVLIKLLECCTPCGWGTYVETDDVAFKSPEQVRHERDLTAAADVWGATATIYAAAVGQAPFGAAAEEGLEARIMWKRVPLPSEVLQRGGANLDLWVGRGMAREPGARFASAEELAAAFEAIVVAGAGRSRIPLPWGIGGEDNGTMAFGLRARLMARSGRDRIWTRKTWLLVLGCLTTFLLTALLVAWVASRLQR